MPFIKRWYSNSVMVRPHTQFMQLHNLAFKQKVKYFVRGLQDSFDFQI